MILTAPVQLLLTLFFCGIVYCTHLSDSGPPCILLDTYMCTHFGAGCTYLHCHKGSVDNSDHLKQGIICGFEYGFTSGVLWAIHNCVAKRKNNL